MENTLFRFGFQTGGSGLITFAEKKSKRGVPVATAVVTVLIINLSMRVPIYGPFEIINVTFWTGEDSVDIIILDCTVRDARNDL
jgi:hypothetical protein